MEELKETNQQMIDGFQSRVKRYEAKLQQREKEVKKKEAELKKKEAQLQESSLSCAKMLLWPFCLLPQGTGMRLFAA